MPVFLERYLLPITAGLTIIVVFTNPMKFDWTQRISGGLALVFISYFFAHTVYLNNAARKNSAEAVPQVANFASQTSMPAGPATTHGANSPAVTGDGNIFNYDSQPGGSPKEHDGK